MAVMYLLVVTVLVFILDVFTGGFLSANFALVPSAVLHQPWTLITSIFLHGGFLHIFLNMFGLLLFGRLLEAKIGERNFIILYFAAGIVGNLGYVFTSGFSSTPVIGASGAVYGILGALAVLQPNLIIFVGFMPMPIYVAVIFWFFTEFSAGVGGTEPGIANFAHVFGLFAGLLLGRIFKREIIARGGWLEG